MLVTYRFILVLRIGFFCTFNLFEIYINLCNKILIFDSTNKKLQLIASQKDEKSIEILRPEKLAKMKKIFVEESQEPYYDAFTEKILYAMCVHYRKLIEKTIQEDSYLIVCDDEGNIIREDAKELKRQLDAGLIGQV